MVVKNELPQLKKIRKILRDRGGILLTSDLAQFNIPRAYLSMLEKNGEIERVARGVYKAPPALEDEMYIFQVAYKSSICSHETALYLHDLTDRSPLYYSVSVPVGYHSAALNDSGHKVFYVNRNLFQMDIQFVNAALRKDKNLNLLYAYAKSFRVQKLIRQYIEVLL